MDEPILHNVHGSAHGEGIRLILGYKGVAWREVALPLLPPRPLLSALTGPYRRQPVLQVGSDVYCDHRCIIRFLEETYPTPSLYPDTDRLLCDLLTLWAEPRVFLCAALPRYLGEEWTANYFGQHLSSAALVQYRQKLLQGSGLDPARTVELEPYGLDQLRVFLELIEMQLADGQAFLLDSRPTLADFSAYIPVYLANMTPRISLLDQFARVLEWMGRVSAIGYGTVSPLGASEAMEIARQSVPRTHDREDFGDPSGRRPGQRVNVAADDYGTERVEGALVASSAHEIAIRHSDPAVGEIVLHFPKVGFRVWPTEAKSA